MPEICNNKTIRKNFLAKDANFRMNAVIHSGQWYTLNKWAKLAHVAEQELKCFLETTDMPIIQEKTSYRVDTEEVFRWYKENNLDIERAIVPNDFSPRIWGGKTETDALLETPQHISNILLIYCPDTNVLHKIKHTLKGYAWCVYNDVRKVLKVYTTSFTYVEQILATQLSKHEYESLIIHYTTQRKWRSLSDFDEEFLGGFLMFYSNFSKQCLKPYIGTIVTYIPYNDLESQIREWVMVALNKFDEKEPVPFSAYLNNFLRFRPYELGTDMLGEELTVFQREHSRQAKALANELHINIDEVDENVIRERMGYDDKNKYFLLLEQTIEFNTLKKAHSLNWADDKNTEKQGTSMFTKKEKTDYDRKRQTSISRAIIRATLASKKYDDFDTLLQNNFEAIKYLNISNEFKQALMAELQK